MSERTIEIYGAGDAAPMRPWPRKLAGEASAKSSPNDARLWRSVREALLRRGYKGIDVCVRDGLITLEGTVEDIPARVLAEDCCLTLPEVRDVRNRLRVRPSALVEREPGA